VADTGRRFGQIAMASPAIQSASGIADGPLALMAETYFFPPGTICSKLKILQLS